MIAPCYLIHGGEPLQTEEIISSIIHQAHKEGYTKRVVFEINTAFNWEELLSKCQNLDLFAEGTVFELRLVSDSLNKQGNQTLDKILQQQDPLYRFIIRAPKLKTQTLNTNWAKYIQQHGKVHVAKNIPIAMWPAWINKRLQAVGFNATDNAINLIAKCYEGNLLAAQQFIQKLGFAVPKGNIDVKDIQPFIDINNQFSLFELTDNVIKGDVERTVTIFNNLRNDKVDPILILWAITREVRILLNLQHAVSIGQDFAQSAQKLGVWRTNMPTVKKACTRIATQQLQYLLHLGQKIDLICKGCKQGNVWDGLLSMCLALSGSKTLSMGEISI